MASFFLLVYWSGLLLVWQARRFKYEMLPDKRPLSCGDCSWWLAVALPMAVALAGEQTLWRWVALVLTALLFIAFWMDAIVMNQFSIQVNPHTLRLFLNNTRAFTHERAETWRAVRARPELIGFPVVALLPIGLLAAREIGLLRLTLPLIFGYTLLWPRRRQFFNLELLAALVLLGALELLLSGSISGPIVIIFAWATLIGMLLLPASKGLFAGRFFHAPSWVQEWTGGKRKRLAALAELSSAEQELVDLPLEQQQCSSRFGALAGSHVVLITLESVSSQHVNCWSGQGARMPVLESITAGGVSSRRHFCISPNTNNALFALYNGNYFNQCDFPHLAHLHAHGYQSIMLVPQDTVAFNFIGLLKDIGFQNVVDLSRFEQFGTHKYLDRRYLCYMVNDGHFYQLALGCLPDLLQKGKKVFLHIMNSQTHPPYLTVAKMDTHDPTAKYRQAMEEADSFLGELLKDLQQWLPPEKTLLCYTADHGQSLGEMGYRSHSNSIAREQINVPFTLSHPSLSREEIPFSTHFDIFPTLFDLLGIKYSYPAIGRSVFVPQRRLGDILFSETRHADTPSCFGYVDETGKLFADLALQRYYRMDWDDRILRELSGVERDRCEQLLYLALQKRGLVGLRVKEEGQSSPAKT